MLFQPPNLAALVSAGCLLLTLLGCSPSAQDTVMFVSGDTAGWITPCGCTSNQSGGLSRRDALIGQSARDQPTLALDVGGNVAGHSQYDLIKLKAILNGLQTAGYEAVNLGGPEAQFRASEIRELQQGLTLPLISANLRDSDGQPIAPPVHFVERGGHAFAIIGVVDPSRVGDDMTALDPYQTIVDLLPSIQADCVIVLAYVDASELRRLAKKLPEIDAMIGGPTGQVLPPSSVGSVLVASSTNKGKFLLRTTWKATGAAGALSPDSEVVQVHSELPKVDRQQANLEDFYRQLDAADLPPDQTTFVSDRLRRDDGPKIAGSQSCLACHQNDDSVWHNSKHANAWKSLQQSGAHVDPACQRCHTTGYGQANGFFSHRKSTPLVNVGCENCHGPSSLHVANATVRTPYDARQQCITCHDHENSPTFKYDPFWNLIRHGNSETIER